MTALGTELAPAEVEQRAVELHVQDSTLEWSILCPNWFFQNLTEGPLRALADADGGVLRLPAGGAAASFSDTRDIATVTVEAAEVTDDVTQATGRGPRRLTEFVRESG